MPTLQFVRNHTDRSNDTGFQFEFHCDKCGNGHLSEFRASKLGVAAGLLRAAGSIFGGVLSQAANAGAYAKDALRGPAWDQAFREAVDECKPYFKQCTRCGHWVCPEVCWNAKRSLCESCAPDLQEEAASIQSQVAVDQAREKAQQSDQTGAIDMAVHQMAQCSHCNARVEGGKFCGACGKPLAIAGKHCTECGKAMSAGAKFCAECGTPSKTG